MYRLTFICDDCKDQTTFNIDFPSSIYSSDGIVDKIGFMPITLPKKLQCKGYSYHRCNKCEELFQEKMRPIWDAKYKKEKEDMYLKYKELFNVDKKALAKEFTNWCMGDSRQHEKLRALVAVLESE